MNDDFDDVLEDSLENEESFLDLAIDSVDDSEQGANDLEELDLEADYQRELLDNMQYPALLIKGLSYAMEFEYLHNRPYHEGRALPLYCFVEGKLARIGFLDMTLSSLLTLGKVAAYQIDLYRSKDDVVPIEINNPEFLEKFIIL